MAMNLIEALPLGILEGRVPPGVKYRPSDHCGGTSGAEGRYPGVTALTAIIQVGAILAVIIYFRSDIRRLASLGSAASLTARPAKRPTTGSLGMSSSA